MKNYKKKQRNSNKDNCTQCKEWSYHISHATEARNNYRADSESINWNSKNLCVSADLQKVVMLPRMKSFKEVIFTHCLITFNERFVPVGKNQKDLMSEAVLWHDGISGRKMADLVSSFYRFYYRTVMQKI